MTASSRARQVVPGRQDPRALRAPRRGRTTPMCTPSQRGLRATHTRRPCRIIRRLNRPRSDRGTIGFNSLSTTTGSVEVVSPSSRDSRSTWVSTGRPGRSSATLRTTFAVLRPTPGIDTSSDMRSGTTPSKRSSRAAAMPIRFRAFERKNPVAADDVLELLGVCQRPGLREPGTGRTAPESPCSPGHRCTVRKGSLPPAARRDCEWSSSQAASGYSSASNSLVQRARPFGVRGRLTPAVDREGSHGSARRHGSRPPAR